LAQPKQGISWLSPIYFLPMMVKKLSESFQHDTLIQKKGAIMKDVEQRARFDDFELEDNYDFSDGIRGRFYKPKKIRTAL